MRIEPELWFDDSKIKGTELPTSYIALSKNERSFLGS
jgi:hypothetical protein